MAETTQNQITSTAIAQAIVASIGGILFGFDTGQISGYLVMDDFLLRYADCSTPGDASTCEFPVAREGLIVALLSIGTAIGALFGAFLADLLGRRLAMSMECIVFTIGIVIQIAAQSGGYAWVQISLGRWVSGLGVGAVSAAVPMYQAETAPRRIRGTCTATYQLFITLGILLAYCVNIGTRNLAGSGQWRVTTGLSILWAAILGIGILMFPESPRWLVRQNRIDKAKRSLERISHVPKGQYDYGVDADLKEIQKAVAIENQLKTAGWIDCFKPRRMTLYRTLLLMVLQSFQQLTGANYFFYYGASIFQSVGIDDSFVTQIILGAVNFGCTFLGLYIMERGGRRWPLIIGGLWQSAWLFVFAAAGTAEDPQQNENMGKLMIVSACLFILGYASTWGPGIWILVGETFPTRTRAKQGALATMSNWIFNFLISFFTPFIDKAISYKYGFVFASCNLAAAITVFLFLYESSGLSLEGVNEAYNNPKVKPWTSESYIPEGYSSRTQHRRELENTNNVEEESGEGLNGKKDNGPNKENGNGVPV